MSKRVVIVGASAAGLYAGAHLAREGCRVDIFERSPDLDPAPRSLIATGALTPFVDSLSVDPIVARVARYELFAGDGAAEVPLGTPDVVVERRTLIEQLAKRATSLGVRLHYGARFTGFEPWGGWLSCRFASPGDGAVQAVTADVLVGADGATSSVARAGGWTPVPTVPLLQARVRVPDLGAETSRVWFRPQDTPYFYWLIPDGDGTGVLGVIGSDPRRLRRRLDAFVAERGFEPLGYQGARIPAYDRWRPARKRVGKARIYLVGDAAGHVKVSTVGGLVTGFRGADAVVSDVASGNGRRQWARLRRELAAHGVVRSVLHRFDVEDYRRLLALIDDRTGPSVGAHTRDEPLRVLGRSLRSSPRIALIAARAFVPRSSARSLRATEQAETA